MASTRTGLTKETPKSALSFDQLLSSQQPFYVRNECKGIVVLTVYQNGQPRPIRLPKTKLPVNLLAKAPAEALRDSHHLRSAIENGHLTVLDPEAAEAELNKDGNRERLKDAERAMGSSNPDVKRLRDRATEGVETIGDPKNPANINPRSKVAFAGIEDDGDPTEEESILNVNSRVSIICELLTSGDKDHKEARDELRNIVDELTVDDITFVVEHVPAGIVRDWAQEELARLRGTRS